MKKTILVTGGAGVIGLSIIDLFYKKGFNVVAAGLSKPEMITKFKNKFSSKRSLILNTELTKSKNVKKVINSIVKKFRQVDVLVNCAGIQFVMPIDKYPEKVWRKMMDINLTTPFLFTKEVLPIMRKNKWGRIINIASTHGLIASVNKSAYTASKHGLVGLTKVTALETAQDPITCNSLCPGFVLTELIQDQIEVVANKKNISFNDAGIEMLREKQPSLKFIKKEDVASMIYFLSSKQGDQITGSNISMDGGWTAQ
jgi:3-hydroxybutyrate dehydrogenase